MPLKKRSRKRHTLEEKLLKEYDDLRLRNGELENENMALKFNISALARELEDTKRHLRDHQRALEKRREQIESDRAYIKKLKDEAIYGSPQEGCAG